MAGQLSAYRDEIFNFLRTVTIKFEPFAYLMGSSYMNRYGLSDPHQEWNPYYINLTGEYAENDTRMEVYSSEEEGTVYFDKTLVDRYPRTAAAYRIPNTEYFTLEERYPSNRGLIRTMVYPAGDMNRVLSAENFELLGYDDSILEQNERASMVKVLRDFLRMVKNRWWIPEYQYEDMYAVTFWAMLWQCLPNVLLMQRFLNIKTPYVHSFHIWEYLTSKGLGDYRDVLTVNQTNWLYRNIDFILTNKGKGFTLNELADNLLREIYVSLLAKDMVQDASDYLTDDYIPRPNYINSQLITGEEDNREDHPRLVDKLVATGLDTSKSADELLQEEIDLGNHPYNKLPTKFLEFKKDPINTSNEALMTNFFLDTLVYRYSVGDLAYYVTINDPVTRSNTRLYVGDALALWYYCCHKSVLDDPIINIPTKYRCHIAFKAAQPTDAEVRQSVYYDSTEYRLKELIDYDKMINVDIPWHPKVFTRVEDFTTHMCNQFRTLLCFLKFMDQSNKFLYHRAMQSFFEDTRINDWLDVKLVNYTTYEEWIQATPEIATLMDIYNAESDQQLAWHNLGLAVFNALFPVDYNTYSDFIGAVRRLDEIYTSIRDLFIQLGSYNITYLENDRSYSRYLRIPEPDFYNGASTFLMDKFWLIIIDGLYFKRKDIINLDLPCNVIDFYCQLAGMNYSYKNNLIISLDWSREQTHYDYRVLQERPEIKLQDQRITHNWNICIETH